MIEVNKINKKLTIKNIGRTEDVTLQFIGSKISKLKVLFNVKFVIMKRNVII